MYRGLRDLAGGRGIPERASFRLTDYLVSVLRFRYGIGPRTHPTASAKVARATSSVEPRTAHARVVGRALAPLRAAELCVRTRSEQASRREVSHRATGGRTNALHVRPEDEPKVRLALEAYAKLREIINALTECELSDLRREARERKRSRQRRRDAS